MRNMSQIAGYLHTIDRSAWHLWQIAGTVGIAPQHVQAAQAQEPQLATVALHTRDRYGARHTLAQSLC